MARIIACTCLAVLVFARPDAAAASETAAAAPGPSIAPSDASDGFNELVRGLVLQNVPHNYEKQEPGDTKRVWDGLHISRDGLRIKTKRRWKDAKHGSWKRYRAWLINPDREFDVQLTNLRRTEEGAAAFDMLIAARLGAFGRVSEWRRGVQLISIGVDAEARVRLLVRCEVSASLDKTILPPAVLLHPKVTAAEISLVDFEVQRISDLHGPLVDELGDALRGRLEDEIEQRRDKLVRRMNDQIEKHPERLRLSLQDLATSGWHKVLEFLQIK